MRLVGFNFNKIHVEKAKERAEELKANVNINISEIRSTKSELFKTKEEILTFDFTYTVDYAPSYAKVELQGSAIFALDAKAAKNTLKQWKDKKLTEELKIPVLNVILAKSNVKALQLEDEMGLPYHMPFPALRESKEKEK